VELGDNLNIYDCHERTFGPRLVPSTPGKNNGSETPIKTAPPNKPGKFSKLFAEVAKVGSRELGRAWVFALALGTVVVWAVSGPFFGFSDTWQLVINTGTTHVSDGVPDPKFAEP
jgi:hypothetical protein